MSSLVFDTTEPNEVGVTAPNGKYIGCMFPLEDGYYYFFPNSTSGAWAGWWMRQIADKLDELNKPWEDHINETLKP